MIVMKVLSSIKVLSEEEINSAVKPILEKGLSNPVQLDAGWMWNFISQSFDYLKIVSIPYSTWFNIEPTVY